MKNTILSIVAGLIMLPGIGQTGEYEQLGMGALLPAPESASLLEFGVKPQYKFANDSTDSDYGVEISATAYVFEYVGVGLAAGFINEESTLQQYTLNGIVKCPAPLEVVGVSFSPYALAGAGLHSNSVNALLVRVGAGVDFQLPIDNVTLFVEGTWNFVGNEVEDYAIGGIGFRYSF